MQSKNTDLIIKRFSKNMSKYNENAVVQAGVAQKLMAELINLKGNEFNSILELGAGTGLLTYEATKSLKFINYVANDLVSESEKFLSEILKDFSFLCCDAEKIQTSEKFDLIISNAVIQWFESFENSLSLYLSLLKDNGVFAFSTFGPLNYLEITELTGVSLEYKSLEEIVEMLEGKFEILYAKESVYQMNFKTPLELLAHMKNTGVNSIIQQHWTIKDVRDFCDKFLALYFDVKLTYNPILVIAQKSDKT